MYGLSSALYWQITILVSPHPLTNWISLFVKKKKKGQESLLQVFVPEVLYQKYIVRRSVFLLSFVDVKVLVKD